MIGARTHSGEPLPDTQGIVSSEIQTGVSSGRRRRRHRTLSEKLRRNHAVMRARRIFAGIILGLAVVVVSIYVARNSTAYEPVPTHPTE